MSTASRNLARWRRVLAASAITAVAGLGLITSPAQGQMPTSYECNIEELTIYFQGFEFPPMFERSLWNSRAASGQGYGRCSVRGASESPVTFRLVGNGVGPSPRIWARPCGSGNLDGGAIDSGIEIVEQNTGNVRQGRIVIDLGAGVPGPVQAVSISTSIYRTYGEGVLRWIPAWRERCLSGAMTGAIVHGGWRVLPL